MQVCTAAVKREPLLVPKEQAVQEVRVVIGPSQPYNMWLQIMRSISCTSTLSNGKVNAGVPKALPACYKADGT